VSKVETVRLEPFNRDRDAGLLAGWLKRPHVVRWWGDPDTQIKAVLEPPVGGGDALIVADGVAVGAGRNVAYALGQGTGHMTCPSKRPEIPFTGPTVQRAR
jgi:hypothetical protein